MARINIKFIERAYSYKILVAAYPPHSTHRLQPLDVSLFSLLANYYSQELQQWVYRSQVLSRLSKRNFFGLFWPAFKRAFSISNIESGWRRTGLLPWDPKEILRKLTRTQAE